MHRRVQVEIEWFIALSDAGLPEVAPLSEATRGYRGLVARFSEADAQAIKDIEKTTNHDVKAVSTGSSRSSLAIPIWKGR